MLSDAHLLLRDANNEVEKSFAKIDKPFAHLWFAQAKVHEIEDVLVRRP
jgi:hypothetical protein